jgi:hypothetical protein
MFFYLRVYSVAGFVSLPISLPNRKESAPKPISLCRFLEETKIFIIMKKIVYNFKQLKAVSKIGFGANVLVKMNANPHFPVTNPTKAQVQAIQDEFNDAILAAIDGTKAQIAIRDAKEIKWDTMMVNYAMNITDLCKGDVEKLLTTGFDLSKDRTPAGIPEAPEALRVNNQNLSGALSVQWPLVAGARTYVVSWSAPGGNFDSEMVALKGKVVVEGLTPGVVYSFRTRAIGSAGQSPWSGTTTGMCP